MVRWSIILLLLNYSLSSAQISNDSVQKILIGTEAQVKYYSKNPKLFTPIALASIAYHVEILKSIPIYQDKRINYFKKVNSIDSSFTLLKIKTFYLKLDTTETDKIIYQIEHSFKKREAEIIGLKIENQNLRKQNYYLRMDTIRWSERCKRAKENESKWKTQAKILEKK